MAQTLAQAALLSENDLQRGVIETFVWESLVLDRLPMLPIEGNAYAYNKELALPGAAFREVNTAYVESTGTVTQVTETLFILGGDADVDTFIVQTRGNLNDQRAVQTRMKVKAAVATYQDAFINGDNGTNSEEFDGLKERLTGGQVITAGANGLPVLGSDDAARHSFMDKVDETIAAVDGPVDALYMPKAIRTKLAGSARRLGFWDRDRDEFGRVVEYYNGIPMLDLGNDLSGTAILPQTETQGTATGVTSSLYAVHFSNDESEAGVSGLENGGISVKDLGETDDAPVYRTRIEYFCGLATFGNGAARLQGILNS